MPRLGVVGDAKLVLADLVDALGDHAPANGTVRDEISRELAQIEAEADQLRLGERGRIHPLYVIRAADRVFPRNRVAAFDVGFMAQQMAGAFPMFRTAGPRTVISPSSYYGMGFVAAALPAARIAHPDRAALCFVGDGSFQMVMNVLPTAVEHRLAVTWLILNDQGLGSIWDIQKYAYGDRILGTEFSVQPDFAGVARACGCHGERVADPAEVEPALARALEANAKGLPAVLDMIVARERTVAAREYFPFK
jgi:acetolactate synthase-1/2/3 large subunit